MLGRSFVDGFLEDVKQALRVIGKSPAFSSLVVLILSLGIGATSAVFSVMNGVMLRSLPVHEPQELVWFRDPSFSFPIFREVRARAQVFSGLFAWELRRLNVDWNGDVQPTQGLVASGEMYRTLGVRPLLGRMLAPEDDPETAVAPELVAVISHAAWQRRMGGDPQVVGKTFRIEGQPVRIVGVTPPEFFGMAPGIAPEVTIPIAALPRLRPQGGDGRHNPTSAWLHLMGRLKLGVSRQQADAAIQLLWPQVLDTVTPASETPERRATYLGRKTGLVDGRTGFSRVRNQFANPLSILMGLVALLLLVACATLANLFLARGASRHREFAVRLALGASRLRIARQLMTEGLAFAAFGGVIGLVLAAWGSDLLVSLLSTSRAPIVLDLAPDFRVFGFTLSIAVLTSVVFGLVPAWRAVRVDPGPALKTSRVVGRERRRLGLGQLLVVSQVGLSVVLIVGAALLARSLHYLVSLDPGFDRRSVVIVNTEAVMAGHNGAQLIAYYGQLLERLRGVPGVVAASLSWYPPLSTDSGSWTESVSIDGAEPRREAETRTYFNAVSPGYFETVRTPLVRGRDFGLRDNESGPRVVIVNESLARDFFPGQDPIGRRISIGLHRSRQSLEIVGIVKEARYRRLQEPTRRIAYLPYTQLAEVRGGANLVAEVRIADKAVAPLEALRREIRAIDKGVPVRFESLEERVQESLVTERVLAVVAAFLGCVALLLAASGLYGLMAYTVSHRTSELGVRMALGAPSRQVLVMVLRESLSLAVLGVALGTAGALALGRLLETLLYGLTPSDPVALAAAGALMLSLTLLAGYLPARRASLVDPVIALRQE